MKCVAADLTTVLAGNGNPDVGDIQKIFESIEADYNSAVTMKLVYVHEDETVHYVFRRMRTS